jgi:hypothetical protein
VKCYVKEVYTASRFFLYGKVKLWREVIEAVEVHFVCFCSHCILCEIRPRIESIPQNETLVKDCNFFSFLNVSIILLIAGCGAPRG